MIALRHSKGSTHAVFGLARSGLATARALVAGGAEVRLWDDNDASRLAASNAELVSRVADLCGQYGRHPASPSEARALLGLRPAG